MPPPAACEANRGNRRSNHEEVRKEEYAHVAGIFFSFVTFGKEQLICEHIHNTTLTCVYMALKV